MTRVQFCIELKLLHLTNNFSYLKLKKVLKVFTIVLKNTLPNIELFLKLPHFKLAQNYLKYSKVNY